MSVRDKLRTIAENEQRVFEAGKRAEYDTFWNIYQQNGERTNCEGMFAGDGWNSDTIRPKYNIYPTKATMMFYYSGFVGSLKEFFENLNIVIDFSNTTSLTGVFQYANKITELPYLDLSSIISNTKILQLCNNCAELVTAEIKFPPSCSYANCFNGCRELKHLVAHGEIGGDGLDFHWSTKLTHDSLMSIINALSATTSGLSVTLSLTAVNAAFETAEGAGDGSTSEAWAALSATRENWTIALA